MTIFQFGQCSEGLGRAAIVLRRPSSAILQDVIQRYGRITGIRVQLRLLSEGPRGEYFRA